MRSMELVASELACIRSGRTVFAGLRFRLASGGALLVTGPNGAGKSSLLRLVAGLLRASTGSLTFTGGDPDASLGEQAHYLGHQDALKPALTVIENLAAWARYFGSKSDIGGALDAVGLGGIANLPAGYLSAGQRRRLSLARLVAIDRPLWLLDEPTSSLDATARALLANLMRHHLAGGGLILAATHEPLGLDGPQELALGGAAA